VCVAYFSCAIVVKFAEITAMDFGSCSPRFNDAPFATLNSDITKSLIADFDFGSLMPSGK
jgi:hypothetical protein